MQWAWQHWVAVLIIFFLGAWIGTMYPQLNVFKRVQGAVTGG